MPVLPRPTSLMTTYLPIFSGMRRVALHATLFHQTARCIHVVGCHQVRSRMASRIAACKNACNDVIQHNSQPAGETVIGLPDRPGLPDVEQAEQHEAARPASANRAELPASSRYIRRSRPRRFPGDRARRGGARSRRRARCPLPSRRSRTPGAPRSRIASRRAPMRQADQRPESAGRARREARRRSRTPDR